MTWLIVPLCIALSTTITLSIVTRVLLKRVKGE